jgi:hypothetical protein
MATLGKGSQTVANIEAHHEAQPDWPGATIFEATVNNTETSRLIIVAPNSPWMAASQFEALCSAIE